MNWKNFRFSTRLNLEGPVIEQVYELITAVDSVKNSWQVTKKLLPQTIERLTHSYQFSLLSSQIGNIAELFNCGAGKRSNKFAQSTLK